MRTLEENVFLPFGKNALSTLAFSFNVQRLLFRARFRLGRALFVLKRGKKFKAKGGDNPARKTPPQILPYLYILQAVRQDKVD